MNPKNRSGWAAEEFAEVNLGDKRLDTRLIKLCDRFSDAPESPINQACVDWAETKAAYRSVILSSILGGLFLLLSILLNGEFIILFTSDALLWSNENQ